MIRKNEPTCGYKMLRPFTRWAAGLLEQTLIHNDKRGKTPWETQDLTSLTCKLREEIEEVEDALANNDENGISKTIFCEENRTPKAMRHLRDELSDVAVTCFMLAARLDPEMSQLRRGKLP